MSAKKTSARHYSPFLFTITILAAVLVVLGFVRTGDLAITFPSFPEYVSPTPIPPPSVLNAEPFAVITTYPRIARNDHIRGPKDAQYVVVMYTDYDCLLCKAVYGITQQFMEKYKGDMAWVLRHFPLDTNKNAKNYAITAECIARRDGEEAFWEYSDTLFDGTSLPLEELDQCTEDQDIQKRLRHDRKTATIFGVGGVPALYIVNRKTSKAVFVVGVVPIKTLQELVVKTQ